MSHTPGPWRWDNLEGHGWGLCAKAQGKWWRYLFCYHPEGDQFSADDERLIAASPELLTACKFLAGFIPPWAEEEVLDRMNPMFYGTGSADGDRQVREKVLEIRALLEGLEKQ